MLGLGDHGVDREGEGGGGGVNLKLKTKHMNWRYCMDGANSKE